MARILNRLSARAVATLKAPGIYADGAGLYLRVKGPTARSWVFVWHAHGRRRETGLGAPPAVGLARARDKAQAVRELLDHGGDPIEARRAARTALAAPMIEKPTPTFGEMADAFVERRSQSVRSDKSVARWKRCIGDGGYAHSLRALSVDQVATADVVGVLQPIWTTKSATAATLRGYIESVLDMAKVSGHRAGDNPARWSGQLEHLLSAPQRLTRGHHAAMPFAEVPTFIAALRAQPALAARALEFTILTAARTSETLKARWEEFDLHRAVWTVPAARMKAGKEHRVPLTEPVMVLLRDQPRSEDYVFLSRKAGQPLSGMAMEMAMRRMKADATVHGFRSSFRDWAGECSDAPREVAEAALAHTVGNAAELAYRRGDALTKRRALMEQWAKFCGSEPGGIGIAL